MCPAERNIPDSGVARVAAVLGAFDALHAVLRVSEIARRAGLPKSTTSRLVRDLVGYGFLERDENDSTLLHMGTRLFECGELASRHRNLRAIALPYMADLREVTRQRVHLAVRAGRNRGGLRRDPAEQGRAEDGAAGGRPAARARRGRGQGAARLR
ncbi:helix-turn-helix domain-containing protein [Streptomyces sp. NPDC048504]|uniref:helix-turn-helix domain-containing protein n=1 Tax=Streptomyces sp. NPDC048504 TaxID=3365559 RepID=UPI0037226EDF